MVKTINEKAVIIGFDGLHRSGKVTQIKLLQNYLNKRNNPNIVIRGDGMRPGDGSKFYDVPSKWWRKNFDYFLQKPKSLEENIYKLNLKYQRLNREAKLVRDSILPKKVSKSKSKLGTIIMDRTFVSRYFTMKQYVPDISLKSALDVKNPKNDKKVEIIIPDKTFILEGSKKLLLQRLEDSEKNKAKLKFKKKILHDHYDLFNSVVKEMKKREDIICLDASLSPEEIHKKVLREYSKLEKRIIN